MFAVLLLVGGCESAAEKERKADTERALKELEALPAATRESAPAIPDFAQDTVPGPLVRPCDRPRPYRDWSNEEISIGLVEAMGRPADEQGRALIAEAACRQ